MDSQNKMKFQKSAQSYINLNYLKTFFVFEGIILFCQNIL